jgi:hypothetical protein
MVDWKDALRDCALFHTSGISFGLAAHSGYERNYLLEAFQEALTCKPEGCRVGLDFNYPAALWSREQRVSVMAQLYGIGCGRYGPKEIERGDIIRYPDSFERHRRESAALDSDGNFFRSSEVRPVVLADRLGGGDTWNGGFYYGFLTEGFTAAGLKKGLLVGDAATRIKQTLMFDLPIVWPSP